MPSRRQSLLDIKNYKGLFTSGPDTSSGPEYLRLNQGLHETSLGELRLSPDDTILVASPSGTGTIHTLARFHGDRFHARGTGLYRENGLIFTNSTAHQLTLKAMPPSNTVTPQLYWCGAGHTGKIDQAQVVNLWGIVPPDFDPITTAVPSLVKLIEAFDAAGDWAVIPGIDTGTTVISDSTALSQSTHAVAITVNIGNTGAIGKSITPLDLTKFVTEPSSDEDYIQFWVYALDYRINRAENFLSLALRLDVGDGSFKRDYYTISLIKGQPTGKQAAKGVGDHTPVNSTGTVADPAPGDITDIGPAESIDHLDIHGGWTHVRHQKRSFLRVGEGAGDWSAVNGIAFVAVEGGETAIETALTLVYDTMELVGGAGTWGDYDSLVTFDNTTLGIRSNSNPVPATTLQLQRQKIQYDDIPTSTDPQVNARTLWRTFGNGALFFREHVIADNVMTSYESSVADFIGLWSLKDAEILFLPELPTDNIKPEDTHLDFIYEQATVMWLSADTIEAKRGRIYFSPAGRPESQRGFIQVTGGDLPLYRLIVWNRTRYAVGVSGFWRIDGTGPYVATKLDGVPGVTEAQAYTVVPTPYGIIWQAKDGLRTFNGSTSQLIFYEAIGALIRDGAAGGFFFQGIIAAYAREQYFFSDGNFTFSCNLATGIIRLLAHKFTTLFYEEDTKLLLGANEDSKIVIIEPAGDASLLVHDFNLITSAYLFPDNTVGYIDQLFVDGSLEVPGVNVVTDGTERSLTAITTGGVRTLTELQVGYPCRRFALHLFRALGTSVTGTGRSIYGIEAAVRDLTLEITTPQGILSLHARSSDLTTSIFFQVLEEQRTAEPFDIPLMLYRFTADAHCHGASFTTTLHCLEGDLVLSAITSSVRAATSLFVRRMGHLRGITLTGNFLTPITLYRLELECRPATLELYTPQGTVQLIARSVNTTLLVLFEVQEQQHLTQEIDLPLMIYRFLADITGASGSPTFEIQCIEGSLPSISFTAPSTRLPFTQLPLRLGHILAVQMTGNFFSVFSFFHAEIELRPVTFEILTPQAPVKLIGRSNDTRVSILFEIQEQQRTTEPLDIPLMLYRLELDTTGPLTASLQCEEGTLTPATIPGTGRVLTARFIRQLGHLLSVTLTGNFFTTVQYFRGELECRPVTFELLTPQQPLKLIGRSNDTRDSILFEVQEQQRTEEPVNFPLHLYRLITEALGSFSTTLTCTEGAVPAITHTTSTRAVATTVLNRMGHLTSLTLTGDFFTAIIYYRAELEMRPVTLELLTPEQPLKLPARSNDTRTSLLFELPEQQRMQEPFDQNILSHFFLTESAGGALTPTLQYEEGDVALAAVSAGARSLTRTLVEKFGHFNACILTGDFFATTQLFRAELELRPIHLDLIINGQKVASSPFNSVMSSATFPGRSTDVRTSILYEIPDHFFLNLGVTQTMVIQRLTIDVALGGATLTPTLVHDKGSLALIPLSAGPRTYYEWPIGLPGRPRQIVLSCNFNAISMLFALELHLYAPQLKG